MQHPGQYWVVNEAGIREDLVGKIQPLNRVSGQNALDRYLGRRTRRRLTIQLNVIGELPVAGPHIPGSGDSTIFDIERVDPDPQPICGAAKKVLPPCGAALRDGASRLLDERAA